MTEFKKIEEFVYEIPKEEDMVVPARLYVDKEMLEVLKEEEKTEWSTVEQLKNTACLPGVQRYALVLSDCHPGYASPIGGVIAMDMKEGVITFGSIGFDINCLPAESKVLTSTGEIKISEFDFNEHKIATVNENNSIKVVKPTLFMKRKTDKILMIKTECGNIIKATTDHPFLTHKGMIGIGGLKEGALVAVCEEEKIGYEKISEIKEKKFNDWVYDFTIPKTHNFIANNFVVSNCGVNSLTVPLQKEDILSKQEELAEGLFRTVPAGLGSRGELKLDEKEIDEVLVKGSEYAVENGYGFKEDLEFTELNGKAPGANPENVSLRAKQRQYKEVGTLGSGNHYLEVQYVEEIFDEEAAKVFGLKEGQVIVSIHCGSRGLGHQIGMDYLKVLGEATQKYGIKIKDKELVCAPIQSEEGKQYFSAVNAGTNCAFANRQVIVHLARGVFSNVLGVDGKEMKMLYGVGHNTAKVEKHEIEGKMKEVLVHRKGSTRGFGPGREEVPKHYRETGQPILVGGTMGTSSYILAGTEKGMKETFGSAVHGAGRLMSRRAATRQFRGENIVDDLKKKGIVVKGHGWRGIAEESPGSYKDINSVIDVMHNSGICKKVAKVKPLISVKG